MKVKRGFDIIFAVVGLSTLWPVFFLVALAIKLDDGGPVIFSQERVGYKGRRFKLLKFRTMKVDAHQGSSVTVANDERITRVGKFLRRTKLDELPQLINVLRGEMSFVGPRPDVPGYADRLEGEDRIILDVLPGITGPAQLAFRNEEDLLAHQADPEEYNRKVLWPKKVEINKAYVRQYSFWKDLEYIWRTVFGK